MSAPIVRAFLFCAVLLGGLISCAQAAPADARLAATTALTFGRLPLPGETLSVAADAPFSTWLETARARLADEASLRRATILRAWEDAFGITPSDAEIARADAGPLTYAERVTRHLTWLANRPADYRAILDRAYRRVVRRPAFDEEISYWREHLDGPLSYILLVGCIDDWARRNQPGLMVTTGTPTIAPQCRALAIVQLSPSLAAEVRTAAALPAAGSPTVAVAAGRNLIAPGAARLTTAGGMHLIAIAAAPPPPAP